MKAVRTRVGATTRRTKINWRTRDTRLGGNAALKWGGRNKRIQREERQQPREKLGERETVHYHGCSGSFFEKQQTNDWCNDRGGGFSLSRVTGVEIKEAGDTHDLKFAIIEAHEAV